MMSGAAGTLLSGMDLTSFENGATTDGAAATGDFEYVLHKDYYKDFPDDIYDLPS